MGAVIDVVRTAIADVTSLTVAIFCCFCLFIYLWILIKTVTGSKLLQECHLMVI